MSKMLYSVRALNSSRLISNLNPDEQYLDSSPAEIKNHVD